MSCVGAPVATGVPLGACPPSPNCVSSRADASDGEHFFPALAYSGEESEARSRMKALVLAQPRTALITEKPGYLLFTFTSATFGYVDDVEMELADGKIQVRSASRVGYGDMGVNRKRMDTIAAAWK